MRLPIAVALDVPSLTSALYFTELLGSQIAMVKVGLQSYLRDGNDGVVRIRDAAAGAEIFLDLKLHDIPQTVANAIGSLKNLQPDVLTIHASGGKEMIKAAVEAAAGIQIAAVTVLTSLADADIEVLSNFKVSDLVLRLADQAVSAGCTALVCSPQEVVGIRKVVGSGIRLIVPGVRMATDSTDDQVRIATPASAIAAGADILVIGRPITKARDPLAQIKEIRSSLGESL